jgi:adenosine kinase
MVVLEDEKTETGECACLIFNKERSMVANLAAANNYKVDHMKTNEA